MTETFCEECNEAPAVALRENEEGWFAVCETCAPKFPEIEDFYPGKVPCVGCEHLCEAGKPCGKCGSDVMRAGDDLCVACYRVVRDRLDKTPPDGTVRTYEVTLRIKTAEGKPSKWEWADLIDDDEGDVVVLDCKEVQVTKLSELCAAIYESSRDGQGAVERFIRVEHPNVPWGRCDACESVEPYEDGACLVCGSNIAGCKEVR